MEKRNRRSLWAGLSLLGAFGLWTGLVRLVDVRAIGPKESSVGFGAVNGAFHQWTGVHWGLYAVTDWLGLVPIGIALGFAGLGLWQLIRRRGLTKVDRSILALGGFYLAVMAAYLLFEKVVVNYRPVLIGGNLEVSYPSSTTLLVLCVIPTAMMQLKSRIPNPAVCRGVLGILGGFAVFMTAGRLISGVHWLSDIVGGGLLSAGLVEVYAFGARQEGRSR